MCYETFFLPEKEAILAPLEAEACAAATEDNRRPSRWKQIIFLVPRPRIERTSGKAASKLDKPERKCQKKNVRIKTELKSIEKIQK